MITTKKDLDKILFGIGVDTMNRFEVFYNLRPDLSPALYWYGLRVAYQDSDNLYSQTEKVRECFSSMLPQRELLMLKREITKIDKLPEIVTIYRGMTEEEVNSGKFGISWTLSKKIADFFINTYRRNYDTSHLSKRIEQKDIPKSKIIAYLNSRKEKEIIYLG
jgi:hypothetical protein